MLREWIEAALEHSNGTHTFEDIVKGISEGRMQLWPAERGVMVTEIVVYPRRKMLNIFLAGGDLDQLLDMGDDMRAWAKAQGCDGAMLTGRKGWARVMKNHGWREKWITMTTEIE